MTARAARLRPDALSCDQARVYEHITGGPRSKGPRAFDITDADGALLGQDTNCPILVINGADDVHVPQQDTLVFEGRQDTEVHLIPGTGHCTKSKLPETIPLMTTWLHNLLSAAKPSAEA